MDKKQVIKDALWVDVGDYFVTRDGRIFKKNWHRSGKTQEVRQTGRGNGYLCFRYNNKTMQSHRFVAEAFISNPDNLPQINHRNEKHNSPEDNNPLNLEWCDAAYNNSYGTRNERSAKARSKIVFQYSLDGNFIREWPSANEVERQLGYAQGNISKCCRGKCKTAYGFVWKYAE